MESLKSNIKIDSAYYKDANENIFLVLHKAVHSGTGESFVVYQSLNNTTDILVCPASTFFKDKFPINKGIQSTKGSKYFFPDIPYTNAVVDLVDGDSFSSSVKGMKTLLLKREYITNEILVHCKKDDDIENKIFKRIMSYSDGDDLEDIFHLIQLWGGMTGRGIYIHADGFNWERIEPHYKVLVDSCLKAKDINDDSLEKLVKSVKDFYNAVPRMGVSFITKHTRYWLMRTLGNNALPIYDSIMAKCVMHKDTSELRNLANYWKAMKKKAEQEQVGLIPLERQIFKYIINLRKWKGNSDQY